MTATKMVSFWVPGGTRAAGVARRSVLSVQAGLPGAIRHRLALLLSELVTNAIQYGGAGEHETVQVRLASSSERVRVEVFDPGATGAGPRNRVEDSGGYGLMLVDRLADEWGREDTETGGMLAWFELSLDHYGDA
ncbi:MAG TPA: ATP-binding protein [Thermoleophilaceae bacterium]|nr:ATP-binding protein [Thermoleophilaceae bacterium]